MVECIPASGTVSNDRAFNDEFVIQHEGMTDVAQQVPPSPGMDHDPSVALESSMVQLVQEPVHEDTSRITYAAPRDSVKQGVHLSPEEDTANLVVSVAIFPKDTNFITKLRSGLLETDDNNAINLDLNADTIFPDRVYLKRWKDPDKVDARHNEVKEELYSVECYSIGFSGKLCSDTADEQCTAEKRNDSRHIVSRVRRFRVRGLLGSGARAPKVAPLWCQGYGQRLSGFGPQTPC